MLCLKVFQISKKTPNDLVAFTQMPNILLIRENFPCEKIIYITIVMCSSLGSCGVLPLLPLCEGEEPSPAGTEKGGQEGCNTMVFLYCEK